ncbi:MAG: hypothetical protein KGJ84_09550 [Elusimicrobia bacterium]|nr:hypothetical protein [Elusimicrobiota bacterium]
MLKHQIPVRAGIDTGRVETRAAVRQGRRRSTGPIPPTHGPSRRPPSLRVKSTLFLSRFHIARAMWIVLVFPILFFVKRIFPRHIHRIAVALLKRLKNTLDPFVLSDGIDAQLRTIQATADRKTHPRAP